MMGWLAQTTNPLTDDGIHVVLAVYGRAQTDVGFLGGSNSIQVRQGARHGAVGGSRCMRAQEKSGRL